MTALLIKPLIFPVLLFGLIAMKWWGIPLSFSFLPASELQTAQHKATIHIKFENVQSANGQIKIALYRDATTFLDTKRAAAFYSFDIPAKGSFDATIENIEVGEYAIAVFHDENGNNQLETNLFGIPTEPYCFSGSGHSKWKPPVFEKAKFTAQDNGAVLTLRLEKWRI